MRMESDIPKLQAVKFSDFEDFVFKPGIFILVLDNRLLHIWNENTWY